MKYINIPIDLATNMPRDLTEMINPNGDNTQLVTEYIARERFSKDPLVTDNINIDTDESVSNKQEEFIILCPAIV